VTGDTCLLYGLVVPRAAGRTHLLSGVVPVRWLPLEHLQDRKRPRSTHRPETDKLDEIVTDQRRDADDRYGSLSLFSRRPIESGRSMWN